MRELLEAVAHGDVSPTEAEARLAGYTTTDAGRFDAAREQRRGVPEAIYAEGKTQDEVVDLALAALETTGRAIATRIDDQQVSAVRRALDEADLDPSVERHDRSDVLVVHAPDFDSPDVDATVCVVTGGTVDRGPAGEAAVIAAEMGADVRRVEDVGVAGIARVLDRLDELRAADVLVVAAGPPSTGAPRGPTVEVHSRSGPPRGRVRPPRATPQRYGRRRSPSWRSSGSASNHRAASISSSVSPSREASGISPSAVAAYTT